MTTAQQITALSESLALLELAIECNNAEQRNEYVRKARAKRLAVFGAIKGQ